MKDTRGNCVAGLPPSDFSVQLIEPWSGGAPSWSRCGRMFIMREGMLRLESSQHYSTSGVTQRSFRSPTHSNVTQRSSFRSPTHSNVTQRSSFRSPTHSNVSNL